MRSKEGEREEEKEKEETIDYRALFFFLSAVICREGSSSLRAGRRGRGRGEKGKEKKKKSSFRPLSLLFSWPSSRASPAKKDRAEREGRGGGEVRLPLILHSTHSSYIRAYATNSRRGRKEGGEGGEGGKKGASTFSDRGRLALSLSSRRTSSPVRIHRQYGSLEEK